MNPGEYELMFLNEEGHWYFRGKRRIIRKFLLSCLTSRNLRILDAGCGTGGILGDLLSFGQVTAIDPFHDATVFCTQRKFCSVAQATVMDLPFADGTFDLVTSLDVIEHVDDDRRALREMRRVLRPGGILMLTVPASMLLWSSHDVALHHMRRYGRGELREKIGSSGYDIIRCTAFNSILFPAVAALRICRRLRRQDDPVSDTATTPIPPVNSMLYRIMDLEAHFLSRMDFPVGVSLACLARKTQDY